MNDNKIGLRIVSALVLIVAIAGIAFFAFQAGVANGSPLSIESPSGDTNTFLMPHYGYGYAMPFHRAHFGFGCFGPLFAIFLLILAFKSFRMMLWGPRWGHMRHWSRHWEGGTPPMFDEWHKKAHESPKGSEKDTE